ncbi:MAG TPA: hypothetical protein VLL72_01780, partial [Kiloniellales bacterium]|nr:hypothetical protein [Kiloniellales bacterium]
MQRLTLLLGHPLYAVALVLAVFLVSAGIGAGLSPRLARVLARRGSRLSPVVVAVGGILLAGAAGLALLAQPLAGLAAAPAAVRVAGAVGLIAPLAFFLGMPFPLALADLARLRPALVPWAWGINGCASVIGAVLAALLALELGFSAVVGLAGALYLAAAILWRKVA